MSAMQKIMFLDERIDYSDKLLMFLQNGHSYSSYQPINIFTEIQYIEKQWLKENSAVNALQCVPAKADCYRRQYRIKWDKQQEQHALCGHILDLENNSRPAELWLPNAFVQKNMLGPTKINLRWGKRHRWELLKLQENSPDVSSWVWF